MSRFILILQFLTRITIKKEVLYDKDFKKGVIYFPLVGLLLGTILAIAYRTLSYIFPNTITLLLVLVIYVALTGGLHLDGLGDTFDGFYSSRKKEEILQIMKDSRLGTNGVLAILFCILLKVFALMALSEEKTFLTLFLIMPIVGRLALVYGCFGSNYPRQKGLGHIFINQISLKEVLIATLITIVIMFINWRTLLFLPILWIFCSIFKKHSTNIIDGMTGDTLGALCELTEVLYLLFLLGLGNLKI